MSQISIRERFYPFSHLPGLFLLLPGSSMRFQIYPKRILYKDLLSNVEGEIELPLEGWVEEFSVVQDLESGEPYFFGKDRRGFFRFRCKREGDGRRVAWVQEKGGEARFELPTPHLFFERGGLKERLSTSSLQQRSWEKRSSTRDWTSLLSTLHRLLSWYPKQTSSLEGEIKSYLLGGFKGILCPLDAGEDPFGYALSIKEPLQLLSELRGLVTSLFLIEKGEQLSLCPALPKELPAGRLKGHMLEIGELDFEWRKGLPRRLSLSALKEGALCLEAKGFRSVRVNGKRVSLSSPISVEKGKSYFMDRFEKS